MNRYVQGDELNKEYSFIQKLPEAEIVGPPSTPEISRKENLELLKLESSSVHMVNGMKY